MDRGWLKKICELYPLTHRDRILSGFLVQTMMGYGIETERFDGVKKEFAPGDFMVMISDGLPELPNPTNKLLDYPKIHDFLNNNREKKAIEISSLVQTHGGLG